MRRALLVVENLMDALEIPPINYKVKIASINFTVWIIAFVDFNLNVVQLLSKVIVMHYKVRTYIGVLDFHYE